MRISPYLAAALVLCGLTVDPSQAVAQVNGTFSGAGAAARIAVLQADAGMAFMAGAAAWKYWAIIISTVSLIGFALAAAYGHFKAQWAGKIVGGLMGLALISVIVFIFTGVTLVL